MPAKSHSEVQTPEQARRELLTQFWTRVIASATIGMILIGIYLYWHDDLTVALIGAPFCFVGIGFLSALSQSFSISALTSDIEAARRDEPPS